EKSLTNADPQVPSELNDRQADNWRPLLAIADLAGADWFARARTAAIANARNEDSDDEAAGVALLIDIATLCPEGDVALPPPTDLVTRLDALKDRRWCKWKNGKPMTERQLARLLAPYGIHSNTIRVGEKTPKGYARASFTDAFARYLPPSP